MQYTTLGRERKGSVTSTTHNVASWFSSLKRTKKGRNYKTEATSKSAWDLSTIRTVVGWFCAPRPSTPLRGGDEIVDVVAPLNYA
jgi:hypothetical protein